MGTVDDKVRMREDHAHLLQRRGISDTIDRLQIRIAHRNDFELGGIRDPVEGKVDDVVREIHLLQRGQLVNRRWDAVLEPESGRRLFY